MKATNYCIRSLVTVRNQLPEQVAVETGQAACRIRKGTRGIAAGRKQPDEGKDDDNRDVETAFGENNNRESTPGTRPKGKNVGRVVCRARKQLFLFSWPSSLLLAAVVHVYAFHGSMDRSFISLSLSLSLFVPIFFSLSFLFSLLSFSRCATNPREEKRERGRFRCESGDPTSSWIDELRKYRRLICVSLHAAVNARYEPRVSTRRSG